MMRRATLIDVLFGVTFLLVVLVALADRGESPNTARRTMTIAVSLWNLPELDADKLADEVIEVRTTENSTLLLKRDLQTLLGKATPKSGDARSFSLTSDFPTEEEFEIVIRLPVKRELASSLDEDRKVIHQYCTQVRDGSVCLNQTSFLPAGTIELDAWIEELTSSKRIEEVLADRLPRMPYLRERMRHDNPKPPEKNLREAPNRLDEEAANLLDKFKLANGGEDTEPGRSLPILEVLAAYRALGALQPGHRSKEKWPEYAKRLNEMVPAMQLYLHARNPMLLSRKVVNWPEYFQDKDGMKFVGSGQRRLDTTKLLDLVREAAKQLRLERQKGDREFRLFTENNGLFYYETLYYLSEPRIDVAVLDPANPARNVKPPKFEFDKLKGAWTSRFTVPVGMPADSKAE